MQRPDTAQHYFRLQNKIDEYIENHLPVSFGIAAMADQLSISYHHLTDVFRTLRGESLGSYIGRRKIDQAAALYSYTALNLDEVADKTGFSTKHALSKAFSKTFGLSPGGIRKRSLYRKHAPNIVLDGIVSEAHYESLLQSDFAFRCEQRVLDAGYLAGYTWQLGRCVQHYENSLQHLESLLADINITGGRRCMRAHDSLNFTALPNFKFFYGVFRIDAQNDVLQATHPDAVILPVKKGTYLVFDVPLEKKEETGQYITLFRENLLWHKRLYSLTDFFDFFLLGDEGEDLAGQYYLYMGL